MTTVRLRYTVERRGRLFWQPTPAMRKMGFQPLALGPDGPEAQAKALALYQAWLRAHEDRGRVTSYPAGTFGAFYDRLRRTETWAKKSLRTREDYERAWVHIEAWRPAPDSIQLSRTSCSRITTELCEQFAAHLERTVSANERWRTIKCLKILAADLVVRLRLPYASPAANLTNPQPKGRSQIWLAAEVEDLAAVAAMLGFKGLSLGIELAWETMLSPVDVRTLRPKQRKRDPNGAYIERARTKTAKQAFAAISAWLDAELEAYLEGQARREADETPILRQRDGAPYRDKNTFGADFRDVRNVAFPGDRRQLMDVRRSASVEADAAGADKRAIGELLANGLADSRFLEDTYTPPTVARARDVAKQRLEGRAKLAGEAGRLRGA